MTEVVRQLWNNLSSIILSLLLAVAVWVAATLQNDPFDVRKLAAVPVTPLNQRARLAEDLAGLPLGGGSQRTTSSRIQPTRIPMAVSASLPPRGNRPRRQSR